MILVNPSYWLKNGFNSLYGMTNAFKVLSEFIQETVKDNPNPSILDTNCRNGALLRYVTTKIPNAIPWGISENPDDIYEIMSHWPKYASHFEINTISNTPWNIPHVDVAILMPGRIVEQPEEKREEIIQELRNKASKVVVYAFSDWIKQFGSLEELCKFIGLSIGRKHYLKDYIQMAEIVW